MAPQFQSSKDFFAGYRQPADLYRKMWYENTTVLLHSERSVADKTPAALSIAKGVADSGRDVLFIAANHFNGLPPVGSERLQIFVPRFDGIDDPRDYADIVFEAIEHAVRNTPIRTFVIDSVSRIAALSFGRNASAAYVMKRLVALQAKCGLSLLVVADDTTKSSQRALMSYCDRDIVILPPCGASAPGASEPVLESPVSPRQQLPPSFNYDYVYNPLNPLNPLNPGQSLSRPQRRALARQQSKLTR